jgi:hypothetical protein
MLYSISAKKKPKNIQIYNGGIIMMIGGSVGLFYGVYKGIVRKSILVDKASHYRSIPEVSRVSGSDAISVGILIIIGCISMIILGLVALHLSKQADKKS